MNSVDWLNERNVKDKTFEEYINELDCHIEKTEDDMIDWFLEDYQPSIIVKIVEGKISTNYGNWEYIEDKDIWIYCY